MIPAGDSHWKQNQSGEFKHNYRFRTPLAKKVDDKSKKHVQDMGRTIRSIVRTIGTLETAFVTVRGCFYGVLCAVEYGTLGWQMVLDLPLVRMALDLLRWFWRYARFVGRNVPLIGVLALIFGRVCLPMIRKAVQDLREFDLFNWLIDWSIYWLTDWLTDRLIDWLNVFDLSGINVRHSFFSRRLPIACWKNIPVGYRNDKESKVHVFGEKCGRAHCHGWGGSGDSRW